MGADFFGAMFKGIGDTFTAGAAVDQKKFDVEQANRDREFGLLALGEADRQGKIAFLGADARNETTIIAVVFAFVAVVIGLIIFKAGKK